MSDGITAALVAGVVSLAVSLVASVVAHRREGAERARLERELQRRLTEKLIDLRLASYPAAFEITDGLVGEAVFADGFTARTARAVREGLASWNRARAAFVMSEGTIRAYRALRDALAVPGDEARPLTEEERRKIWESKNSFRGSLRRDVNLLYEEEKLSKMSRSPNPPIQPMGSARG